MARGGIRRGKSRIQVENMQSDDLSRLLLPIGEQDHVLGPKTADLTLVEYGDYECPGCGALYLELKEVQRELGARLCVVYRQYPLAGMHPHAQEAAEAAEAAAAQGKFWEMHDLLFQNQRALKRHDLVGYAEQLGLDVGRFRRELGGRVYEERVREDFRSGVQNGVYGTPGLFLNGIRHQGEMDQQSLIARLTAKV